MIQIAIYISPRYELEKTNSICSKVCFIATKVLTSYVGCWKTRNMSYVLCAHNWLSCSIISLWIFTIIIPHFEVLALKHLFAIMAVMAAAPSRSFGHWWTTRQPAVMRPQLPDQAHWRPDNHHARDWLVVTFFNIWRQTEEKSKRLLR